jgi:hypothetical protein
MSLRMRLERRVEYHSSLIPLVTSANTGGIFKIYPSEEGD